MKTESMHTATVAEIGLLANSYSRKRDAAVRELAALQAAREFSDPEPALMGIELEARKQAIAELNGYAPAELRMPTADRETILKTEILKCDIVLNGLASKDLEARATEAAEFAEAHGEEWRHLCKEIVLTASRLKALEAKAAEFRRVLGTPPAGLPMADAIGVRSVTGAVWARADGSGDALMGVVQKAIQQRIVSAKEITEAQNVQ